MQFGAFWDYANRSLQFMLSNRLCIMSPYTGGKILHPWDEKIFQLNQYKGSCSRSLFKLWAYCVNSADNRRVHEI